VRGVEVNHQHVVEHLPHFLWPVLNAIGIHEVHPIFDRIEAVNVVLLLVLTLLLGASKITFGFAIGFYNVLKHHGLKDAILEKGTWIIGMIMLTSVILGFIYNQANGVKPPIPIPIAEGWQAGVNEFYIVALPLALIGFIMFIAAEVPKMGVVGLVLGVEILTWLGQIMSYARLLAIGLSSVYIAFVMNFIGIGLLGSKGGIFLVIGAIVLIFGHTVNLILGILDPGLQSLRLHYVEFFPKFLEGGGKLFEPFGRKRRFIEG
jgi:V/A-type H+-transporting ATPase subunit I